MRGSKWNYFGKRLLTPKTLGALGETLALAHLEAQGMHKVVSNWRCAAGEIDIILVHKNELVVVEVKTRTTDSACPQDLFVSITQKKKRKLRYLGELFWAKYCENRCLSTLRIDVVGIALDHTGHLQKIEHLRGIGQALG